MVAPWIAGTLRGGAPVRRGGAAFTGDTGSCASFARKYSSPGMLPTMASCVSGDRVLMIVLRVLLN